MATKNTSNPVTKLKQIREREAAKRRANAESTPTKPVSAEIITLPEWSKHLRGVPNSVLRGALFAAIQGKNRQYLNREPLAAQDGIEIRFTGMQLDQSDLDVWEQLLQLAQQHPLGTQCEFSAYSLLKALRRKTGKSDHEWLKNVLARLMGCGVEITHNRKTYGGSLIEFYRDEDTQYYVLEINHKIKALYSAGWTACDWEQRQQLRGKPLALWLHGFYGSHAKPLPHRVETLHRLCGSTNKNIRGFKRDLKKALDDLKIVGAISDWQIDDNLVSVTRKPSASQRKFLGRNKSKK